MAAKAKTGSAGKVLKAPVHHKTNQGNGRGSRASHGRKLRRGQGRG